MDPTKIQQIVQILKGSRALNLKVPAHLDRAKKILQMANGLKGMSNLPPEITSELIKFYDTVGARPEVAGVKTTVQGNRWEDFAPAPMPFSRNYSRKASQYSYKF